MNLGKVVADYGDVLAKPSDLGLVRDINSLPHLKSEIRAALKAVLAVTTNATMREHLKIAYISLAEFQTLSHREMLALRAWNIGVAEAAASKLQTVSDVALTTACGEREQIPEGGFGGRGPLVRQRAPMGPSCWRREG